MITPDAGQKLELLAQVAGLDCEGDPGSPAGRAALTPRQEAKRDFLAGAVVQVQRPDGPMTVLRTLQTSACEQNCYYCPFRAGRSSMPRVRFSPDELAGEFDRMLPGAAADFQHVAGASLEERRQHRPDRRVIAVERAGVETAVGFGRRHAALAVFGDMIRRAGSFFNHAQTYARG